MCNKVIVCSVTKNRVTCLRHFVHYILSPQMFTHYLGHLCYGALGLDRHVYGLPISLKHFNETDVCQPVQ